MPSGCDAGVCAAAAPSNPTASTKTAQCLTKICPQDGAIRIKAFSETDTTEDLKKFDVLTLILHGDDDQIVPIGASATLSSKIGKNATLKVYKGAQHGMCTTHKDQVNADLL